MAFFLMGFGVLTALVFSMAQASEKTWLLALSESPTVHQKIERHQTWVSEDQETVSLTGSETLSPFMNLWAQALTQQAPWLALHIQASGSATAPIALASGRSIVGPMSRKMTPVEALRIRQARRQEAIEWPLALDAIVFYVHPMNPLTAVSSQAIEQLFAQTPLCYPGKRTQQWRDLPPFLAPKQPYSAQDAKAAKLLGWRQPRLIGRNSTSGTHYYVRHQVLCGGFFRTEMAELPSAVSVIQAIAREPSAIGYASWSAHLNTVKALSIDQVAPNQSSIRQRGYPWTRTLYLYVMAAPDQPMSKGLWTTLSWVYSTSGQAALLDLGFVPLSNEVLQAMREQLSRFKPPQWVPLFDLSSAVPVKEAS